MLCSIYRMTIFARSCMTILINLMEGMVVMEKETNNSLIGCMREVPNPRAPYNQKHKFPDIIIITITAVPSGMDTWNEIEDWASPKKEWLGQFLELPGGVPSHDTINWVFQMIDSGKFHGAFWSGQVLSQEQLAVRWGREQTEEVCPFCT